MRIGLFTSMGGQTWPGVLELWRHSEATGWDSACDTRLAGTPDRIREQLGQLRAAGVDALFLAGVPRPLADLRRDLDRFIAEIAPAFR